MAARSEVWLIYKIAIEDFLQAWKRKSETLRLDRHGRLDRGKALALSANAGADSTWAAPCLVHEKGGKNNSSRLGDTTLARLSGEVVMTPGSKVVCTTAITR